MLNYINVACDLTRRVGPREVTKARTDEVVQVALVKSWHDARTLRAALRMGRLPAAQRGTGPAAGNPSNAAQRRACDAVRNLLCSG